jgi:hypothetical protein
MISLKKQTEFNTTFNTTFNTLIHKDGVNIPKLLEQFNTFEKTNVNDETFRTILKSMLNIPYYKNLIEVNVLIKFRMLQDKLLICNSKLRDNEIILRLDDLINK